MRSKQRFRLESASRGDARASAHALLERRFRPLAHASLLACTLCTCCCWHSSVETMLETLAQPLGSVGASLEARNTVEFLVYPVQSTRALDICATRTHHNSHGHESRINLATDHAHAHGHARSLFTRARRPPARAASSCSTARGAARQTASVGRRRARGSARGHRRAPCCRSASRAPPALACSRC
jgi:hypothetical protein